MTESEEDILGVSCDFLLFNRCLILFAENWRAWTDFGALGASQSFECHFVSFWVI